ncbi:D-isomer specific 2-hydroxyacid dehydrogenase [Yarrowia lipolytica]|nr:D-isomer specific 2-hydroxyacid dehydrogenase [Yarrowia lipolytica]
MKVLVLPRQLKLLGCTENELADSVFDKEIVDADVVITTPFHPGYINKELKIYITAGVGSDHANIDAANARDIAVLEVIGFNVQSVAENVVMTMLVLRVLKRLAPFNPLELLYYDYQPMPANVEKEIGCRQVESLEKMLSLCDAVTINCPLHTSTKGLFNKVLFSHMKDGVWLVNTARGAICVTEDIAKALKSGKIRAYGGDVWFPQPAPKYHPWRTMRNKYSGGNAMTPRISGTSIGAQGRSAEGNKKILKVFLSGKQEYRPQDIICINGHYGTKAYGHDKEHKKHQTK